ncbi:MAG: squalene synthase HpnC [bacterium]|nr:squalene synthase HpnC [bacterium]
MSIEPAGPMSRPAPVSGLSTGPVEQAEPVEQYGDIDTVMARASGENFPVALGVLPRRLRKHLTAIYGYARLVDNLGDEYGGDRSAALDWLESQIDDLYAGTPRHEVFRRLEAMVQAFDIPRTPFDQLLAANRLDQSKTAYADWEELLGYCELSANPVGHLVLAVFEASTPRRRAASDAVCSGLQVLEHLQDIGEDAAAGRVYLPAADMERFGCTPADLTAPVAGEPLRRLVAFECERARELLDEGRKLVTSLRGFARLAITGFVAGGLAGLDAIEAAGFEVLGATRTAGAGRQLRRAVPLYLGAVLRWGSA